MHIYCTKDEVAIEGSIYELRNIAKIIEKSKSGEIHFIDSSLEATAEPYDKLCDQLILDCNGSKIKGSIENNKLKLEFSEETIDVMSSFFDFGESSQIGQHYHFDKFGNEDYFEGDSIEMVVQIG